MGDDNIGLLDLLSSFTVATGWKNVGDLSDSIKNKGGRIVDKVKKDPNVNAFKRRLKQQVDKIDARFRSKNVISNTEKTWFSISILQIFYFGLVIGRFPEWVHVAYSVQLAVLLPIRMYEYFRRDMHYYIADLCYFVNLIVILNIWVFPESKELWIASNSFAFGTLPFAVITWHNALVLHSIDKTTSTFIHLLPAVVLHTINFRLEPEWKEARFPAAYDVEVWDVKNSLIYTTVAYFVWQALYHYFITIRKSEKIKSGRRVTSFVYLKNKYADTPLGRIVTSLPEKLQIVAFTLIQFCYQMTSMVLCPLWYQSQIASSIFLTIIFAISAYNGATYYIDIFGQRFHSELLQLQNELDQAEIEPKSKESSVEPQEASSSASNVSVRNTVQVFRSKTPPEPRKRNHSSAKPFPLSLR